MCEEHDTRPRQTAAQHIGEGIGCLLIAIAIAVIVWAFVGFPSVLA